MKILSATSESPAFRVLEIKTVAEGKAYEITIAPAPPYVAGTNTTIVAATSWTNYSIRIPAYMMIQQAIHVQPHALTLPAEVKQAMPFQLMLYSMRPGDVFSDAVSSDDRSNYP